MYVVIALLGLLFLGVGSYEIWKRRWVGKFFGLGYVVIGILIVLLIWPKNPANRPVFSSTIVQVYAEDGTSIPDATVKIFYECEMTGMENNLSQRVVAVDTEKTDATGTVNFSGHRTWIPIFGNYYFRTTKPCGKHFFIGKEGYCAHKEICVTSQSSFREQISRTRMGGYIVSLGGYNGGSSAASDYQGFLWYTRIDNEQLSVNATLYIK